MQQKRKRKRCMKKLIDIQVDKSKYYILACSFGPDSMALLDILSKNHIKFVVCHVNYHKRDMSNFEENALKEYCFARKIPIEILDTSKLAIRGNFQSWAREVRYNFFSDCYKKYNASGLFVAHQLDDHFETYLMQKERGMYVSYYGIKENSSMFGMNVIRPLLSYSKKDLKEYDDKNNVPYSIDCSNLTDDYRRNYIRHHIVEKLTFEERNDLARKIEKDNSHLNIIINKVNKLLKDRDYITVDDAKKLSHEQFAHVVFKLLSGYGNVPISNKEIDEFVSYFSSSKSNIAVLLADNLYYLQEYGVISIRRLQKPYKYVLDKPGCYHFDEFDINFEDANDRNIKPESYPITIRTFHKNDKYIVKNYKCNVNRLFLDWKMPFHLRSAWPIIEDCNGNIIYIPRYRKWFSDKHKSIFKIYLK